MRTPFPPPCTPTPTPTHTHHHTTTHTPHITHITQSPHTHHTHTPRTHITQSPHTHTKHTLLSSFFTPPPWSRAIRAPPLPFPPPPPSLPPPPKPSPVQVSALPGVGLSGQPVPQQDPRCGCSALHAHDPHTRRPHPRICRQPDAPGMLPGGGGWGSGGGADQGVMCRPATWWRWVAGGVIGHV